MITGSLQDDEVHRHIVVGSSSLGHWHTGVGSRQGKQRNEEIHSAVAVAQIAHTESGIVHAPPPEEPEQRRGSLYEIVEKRLAEARARSATPVHPSRVNDSPVRKNSNIKLRATASSYVANESSCVTHGCLFLWALRAELLQALRDVLNTGEPFDAESVSSKPPSVAASVEGEQDAAPGTVAGTPTRRRRSGALSARKTFQQGKTKITNL